MQEKALGGDRLDLVGKGRGLFDMTARGPHASLRGAEGDAGIKRPLGALGRAAGGDLAGFGGAVDFEQGCPQAGFDGQRQLRGHGRRGRQDEVGQGNLQARRQQCLQVDGRRHQHAGAGRAVPAPSRCRPGRTDAKRPTPSRFAGRSARWTRSRTCAAARPSPRCCGAARPASPAASPRRARCGPARPSFCGAPRATPVEPEVNTMAAVCAPGIEGMSYASTLDPARPMRDPASRHPRRPAACRWTAAGRPGRTRRARSA